jgi:hypothetical protein
MCYDNKAAINIADNHKIGDRSKHIDVAYALVYENIECGWITRLQAISPDNHANAYTKRQLQIILWKLRTTMKAAK